ncbi:PKD domain-containing protein, partial [Methanoregula sp.]|uniref:PKD domain-containing protein n=1 Tax=Methanoregula sp. TaxID=2052170 RepID=UPI0025DCABE1
MLSVSHVSPGNYPTIQTAINAALSGDTVKVYPGTYDERIIINRSITLLGATSGVSKKDYIVPTNYAYDESKESIISPSSVADVPVVQIWNSKVTFDGFIVKFIHSTEYPEPYPVTDLISINNQSNEYTDVRIVNNVVGPNTNLLSQNGKQGRMGIVVPGPRKKVVQSLTIANNKIFNATGDGCGILLLGSQNIGTPALAAVYEGSIIDNNTISGNHRSGIELSGGVQGSADTAGHFRITNNNITHNGWNNTADKNTLKYGNGIILIRIGSDITTYKQQFSSAWGPRYVDIDNNLISENEKIGIYIGPTNQDITIKNNILSKNGAGTNGYSLWDGVRVDLDESYHGATDKNYGNLTNIVLKGNDIINNGDYGVRVIQTPTLGSIDARNNWWGNASGPRELSKSSTVIASNVSDNVLFSPWYTSPAKSGASTLPKPMATFTVDKVEDTVPAKFSFDASASESQSKSTITSYQWDYGDGNKSAASKSPLSSWTYEVAKVQTITLTVKDSNGMTNTTTRQVTVIAKKEFIPITFNGTTISGTTGKQEITFVSANLNGTMTNTTNTVTIVDPGNGWDQMIVKGNTSGTAGTTVTVQNITEVVLSSKPVVTQLDTTATGPGEVTTSIQLSLKELANAPLQVEVTQGANDTVSNAFQLAAGSDNKVDAVAYTMIIKGSSLINSNLSASTEPVVLNMSVSESWVNSNGGIGAMKVIRFSDDGATKEVLDTQYIFTA